MTNTAEEIKKRDDAIERWRQQFFHDKKIIEKLEKQIEVSQERKVK